MPLWTAPRATGLLNPRSAIPATPEERELEGSGVLDVEPIASVQERPMNWALGLEEFNHGNSD
jgi:hypothetical protein